jgi:hypothetical protein
MNAFSQFATAIAAAEVIARRMPLFWWAAFAPNAGHQAEIARMVSEKNAAFLEGLFAANSRAAQEAIALWGKAMTGRLGHDALSSATSRILHAAGAPATRRVKANHKRLRRRKRF